VSVTDRFPSVLPVFRVSSTHRQSCPFCLSFLQTSQCNQLTTLFCPALSKCRHWHQKENVLTIDDNRSQQVAAVTAVQPASSLSYDRSTVFAPPCNIWSLGTLDNDRFPSRLLRHGMNCRTGCATVRQLIRLRLHWKHFYSLHTPAN